MVSETRARFRFGGYSRIWRDTSLCPQFIGSSATMSKILKKEELARVTEIDAGVKNKFKWEWLEKKIDLKIEGKIVAVRVGDSIA